MSWLLQNLGQRARFAVKNPRYTVQSIFREITLADERFLARVTGVPPLQIRAFLDEPFQTPAFAQHLRGMEEQFRSLPSASADLFGKKVLNQYAAARALAPDCIVETGVANGVSSAYLLLALQKNGRGRLHSVGLADPEYLPPGKGPGWLVPDWLRADWRLHIGDARNLLPGLFTELREVGMFIHDSLHTYEHMLWEYQTAYPYLRPGGLLVSDDALWNSAFRDFARSVGVADARILRGVGFLRKNPS